MATFTLVLMLQVSPLKLSSHFTSLTLSLLFFPSSCLCNQGARSFRKDHHAQWQVLPDKGWSTHRWRRVWCYWHAHASVLFVWRYREHRQPHGVHQFSMPHADLIGHVWFDCWSYVLFLEGARPCGCEGEGQHEDLLAWSSRSIGWRTGCGLVST